jgi:hypothetical protein
MSIGIEHKLKGYLSRIEKIKADGTREVISADIEVPNTIVNLGRRMVSGEWIHRDAGNPISNNFSKNRITYFQNSSGICDFALCCDAPNDFLCMSTAEEKQYSKCNQRNVKIWTPGSIFCISSDGRDTSLDDTFEDYLDSILIDSHNDMQDTRQLFPASTNASFENSTVKPYYYYGIDNSNDEYIDIYRRKTLRSIAVKESSVVRSILFGARKENVSWVNELRAFQSLTPKLFSRIVLPEPITLEAGERLIVTYDFHIIVSKAEVTGSINGINYSVRPYIRCGTYSSGNEQGNFSNYMPGMGRPGYVSRNEEWAPIQSNIGYSANFPYSFSYPPLFYVDDIAMLLANDNNMTANWQSYTTSWYPTQVLTQYSYQSKSGVLTSSVHATPSIVVANKGDIGRVGSLINPQKPVSLYNGNIYSQNYPGCPETMMRGLDWQLTPDGKATFESCYAIQPTAGAMNIYGLLAHGAIVCFGKYDENGTWVDEPIIKSATQKAMISLKTVWNFD